MTAFAWLRRRAAAVLIGVGLFAYSVLALIGFGEIDKLAVKYEGLRPIIDFVKPRARDTALALAVGFLFYFGQKLSDYSKRITKVETTLEQLTALLHAQEVGDLTASKHVLGEYLHDHRLFEKNKTLIVLGLTLAKTFSTIEDWIKKTDATGWRIALYCVDPRYVAENRDIFPRFWQKDVDSSIERITAFCANNGPLLTEKQFSLDLYKYGVFPAVTGHVIGQTAVSFGIPEWEEGQLSYADMTYDSVRHDDRSAHATESRKVFNNWLKNAQSQSERVGGHPPAARPSPIPLGRAQGFFQQVPRYYVTKPLLDLSENTLSRSAWDEVETHVASQIKEARLSGTILDVGGGTGYFSFRLSRRLSHSRFLVCDRSKQMLQVGRDFARDTSSLTTEERQARHRVSFSHCEALQLPFLDESAAAVLLFCVQHLIENKKSLMQQMYRVLDHHGKLFILTFRPEDLRETVYHRYFPKFWDFDGQRYPRLNVLKTLCRDAGFQFDRSDPIPYSIKYDSIEQVVDLATTKPFSTFSFYEPAELTQCTRKFHDALRKFYGAQPVSNESRMTLLTFSRP